MQGGGVDAKEEKEAYEQRAQHVHLAALAVEAQGETASVGKPQGEGAAQRRMLAEALADGVTQAVAASHEGGGKETLLRASLVREWRKTHPHIPPVREGSWLRGAIFFY